jgi:hypothetical protein
VPFLNLSFYLDIWFSSPTCKYTLWKIFKCLSKLCSLWVDDTHACMLMCVQYIGWLVSLSHFLWICQLFYLKSCTEWVRLGRYKGAVYGYTRNGEGKYKISRYVHYKSRICLFLMRYVAKTIQYSAMTWTYIWEWCIIEVVGNTSHVYWSLRWALQAVFVMCFSVNQHSF